MPQAKLELIADIGSNWRVGSEKESKKRALTLVREALQNGASTVKFQLFRADELYRDAKLQKRIREFELPVDWLQDLKNEALAHNGKFMVTPFYLDAVDEIQWVGVDTFKIASWDLTYDPLLEKVSQTGLPVIMSTGAASMAEIDHAVGVLRPGDESVSGVTLMHCTGGYPTAPEDANLRRIVDLAQEFWPVPIGFSSHVIQPHLVAATTLFMVETIEVHFDLADGLGTEHAHSYTPEGLAELRAMCVDFIKSRDCGCAETFPDYNARMNYRRDPSDWLRPILKGDPLR